MCIIYLVFLQLYLSNVLSPLDRLPTFCRASPVVGVPPQTSEQASWSHFSLVGLSGRLLLAHASTVILGSESCGTHYRILLSNDSGSHATLIHRALILVWSLPFNLICLVRPARSFSPCILCSQDHTDPQALSPHQDKEDQGKGPTTLERATGE
jgi:hypothetical protein